MHGASASSFEDVTIPVLSERQIAEWRRALGHTVIERHGRWWAMPAPGFLQPVHALARFSRDEALRPASWCWGYNARLADLDEKAADARLPAHLLTDLPAYALDRLAPERRRLIRKALRDIDVVALDGPDLLLSQGPTLMAQANRRNPAIPCLQPAAFRRLVLSHLEPRRGLVLAALQGGRLCGFSLNLAVDGTAYAQHLWIGDGPAGVALALTHAFATVARRTAGIEELANGMHIPEQPGLTAFKRRLGFEVHALPARAWIAPGAGRFLKIFQPNRYYRLTGKGP